MDSRRPAQRARASLINPTRFTAHQEFSGALKVRPDLQGVTSAMLRTWLAHQPVEPVVPV